MKPLQVIGVVVFSLYSFLSISLGAQDSNGSLPLPFKVGERLSFKISWGLFSVGKGVMEVHDMEDVNGTKCHKISLDVSTNKFADAFYKVRTRAVSYVEEGFGRSILYKKSQKEGKTNREIVLRFDYQKNLAHYSNHGVAGEPVKIPDRVFDPLAISYLFRMSELKTGGLLKLPTCDGKRFREIEVLVGEQRKMKVPAGSYETFEVSPALKNLRGVFSKSPDGFLHIWYTADKLRMPIRMKSKVAVGSFVAKLVDSQFP